MSAPKSYDFPNATIKIYRDGTAREFPRWCPCISVVRSRKYVADALRKLRVLNRISNP